MLRYVSKRVLQLIIVFFVVSILIFTVVRMTPMDPIASISKGKAMSEETKQALMREYNLDKSLPGQYFTWIKGIFHGDLGKSFQYRESVTKLLSVRYKTSAQLMFMSALMIIFLAIPLGVICAAHKNSLLDQALTVPSLIIVSSPPFFTGILLMLLFTMVWPVFPTFGTADTFWGNLKYLFLPAVSLAAVRIALSMRITRSNINAEIVTLTQDEVYAYQFGEILDSNGIRDYDCLVTTWGADYPDPSANLDPLFNIANIGAGGYNCAAYYNEEIDSLLNKAVTTIDDGERMDLLFQACDIIVADAPYYFYNYTRGFAAFNKNWSLGDMNITSAWDWNFKNVVYNG